MATLILKSGIATGSGSSKIQFSTVAAGAAGTADRTPSTVMTILGNGSVGIGTVTPQALLDVSDDSERLQRDHRSARYDGESSADWRERDDSLQHEHERS